MPTKRPRPWLVNDRTRKGPQGRPRSGPDGVAVRQLARITLRGSGRTLALWDALRHDEQCAPHEMFARLVEAYMARLEPERAATVMRDARTRRRTDYRNTP